MWLSTLSSTTHYERLQERRREAERERESTRARAVGSHLSTAPQPYLDFDSICAKHGIVIIALEVFTDDLDSRLCWIRHQQSLAGTDNDTIQEGQTKVGLNAHCTGLLCGKYSPASHQSLPRREYENMANHPTLPFLLVVPLLQPVEPATAWRCKSDRE